MRTPDTQAKTIVVHQSGPRFRSRPTRPWTRLAYPPFDPRQLTAGERTIARVSHKPIPRAVGVKGWTFLIAGRILRMVGPMVHQSTACMYGRAVQAQPALVRTLAGDVIQRPVQRDALYIDPFGVIAVLQQFRYVAKGIADLDRIPADETPFRFGLLSGNRKRDRARVVRHLNLPPAIVAVDKILLGAATRKVSDRASHIQIDAKANHAVVQIAHLGQVPPGTLLAGVGNCISRREQDRNRRTENTRQHSTRPDCLSGTIGFDHRVPSSPFCSSARC